jgi:hypothetical protein
VGGTVDDTFGSDPFPRLVFLVSHCRCRIPNLSFSRRVPRRGKPIVAFTRLLPRSSQEQRDVLAEVIAATLGMQ